MKNNIKNILSLVLITFFLNDLLLAQNNTDPSQLLRVVNKELIGKKRVGRSLFEYEYRLTAENNTGKDYDSIFVTATSNVSALSIIDDVASFGILPAFSTRVSEDTIKIHVDRMQSFDPSNLFFTFDNNSIEGLDINNNDVRDDVEIFIESLYSKENKLFAIAMDIAKSKQINTTQFLTDEEIRESYLTGGIAAICMLLNGEDVTDFSAQLQEVQFNTPERIAAFRAYEQKLSTLGSFSLPSSTEIENQCSSKYPQ